MELIRECDKVYLIEALSDRRISKIGAFPATSICIPQLQFLITNNCYETAMETNSFKGVSLEPVTMPTI